MKWTSETYNSLIELLMCGKSISKACSQLGMKTDVVYKKLDRECVINLKIITMCHPEMCYKRYISNSLAQNLPVWVYEYELTKTHHLFTDFKRFNEEIEERIKEKYRKTES